MIKNWLLMSLLVLSSVLSFPSPSSAACNGPSTGWSHDSDDDYSCAPCSHTAPLSEGQKYHPSCANPFGTDYKAARITWQHENSGAATYQLFLFMNGIEIEVADVNSTSFVFNFIDYGYSGGDELCAEVQAIVGGVRSDTSERSCVIVPAESVMPAAPTALSISFE